MKILIPTPLRQYAGKRDAINIQANTINDALAKLTGEHPELRRHLFTDEGKLRAFVNLYLNDDDVRYLADKENTRINDGDSLSIIPSIAGGCWIGSPGDRATLKITRFTRFTRF